MKRARKKIKLHVVKNPNRPNPKVIVQLPYEVLSMHKKGDQFFVFYDKNTIVLSKSENIGISQQGSRDIPLKLLTELFIRLTKDELGKRALLKHRDLVEKIVSVL